MEDRKIIRGKSIPVDQDRIMPVLLKCLKEVVDIVNQTDLLQGEKFMLAHNVHINMLLSLIQDTDNDLKISLLMSALATFQLSIENEIRKLQN